jgi:hypothetical protein
MECPGCKRQDIQCLLPAVWKKIRIFSSCRHWPLNEGRNSIVFFSYRKKQSPENHVMIAGKIPAQAL